MRALLVPRFRFTLATFLVVAALAPAIEAGQTIHQATIPHQSVPYQQSVVLPRFDPELGFLRDVLIGVSGNISGTAGIENTSSSPNSLGAASAVAVVRLTPTLPAGSMSPPNPAFEPGPLPPFAAYDGTTDFAGPSGTTLVFTNETGTGAPSMSAPVFAPSGLAIYTGPSGNPGTVTITIDALDISSPLPPGFVRSLTLTAGATISIHYNFDSFPATFCTPSQSGFYVCPCGNFGTFPRGCANSANSQGAGLSAQGQASLANDTLVLAGQGMPDTFALFVQASSFSYGGVFQGDGLGCTAGTLLNLGAKANVAGASQYPASGDVSISIKGQIAGAGGTRYYQMLYRDNASFCTPAGFNTTNAVAVLWQP